MHRVGGFLLFPGSTGCQPLQGFVGFVVAEPHYLVVDGSR